jgi:hypothetical protein
MAHQKVTSDFPTAELPQITADEQTLVISFEVPPLANSTPVLTNWAFSASLSAIEYSGMRRDVRYGSKSGYGIAVSLMSALPQNRTSFSTAPMSALFQKQTLGVLFDHPVCAQ